MKSFADQFSSFKNRYRDSNVVSIPPYTSLGVGAMSVYKSTVLPICSPAAAAACSEEFTSDSPTDLQTGDTVAILNTNTLNNNNSPNNNIVSGPSSDSDNTSCPSPTEISVISTMGQLQTSQSSRRNNSFNNDNNNNDNSNRVTSAASETVQKRGLDYSLPTSTLPDHRNISAQGSSSIQPKLLFAGESSVDNDNSSRVSPEQSMEKHFELDKNINVEKPCSSKVYLVDRNKVQYAEGDLDSAEEAMENLKFSNDTKNTDFSDPVSPSSTGTENNKRVSQDSLDSLDKQKGYTSFNEDEELYTSAYSNTPVQVPIIGYETMEQRARFTVFKLQVIHSPHDSWFVFRRYTDFVQLSDKLKNISPTFLIPLPPKRWFGDNFDRHFLEDRQRGLQDFINRILKNKILCECAPVREFFCFDDPPGPHDSLEESRALCESLEEQTYNLKKELKDKEHEIDLLKTELNLCKSQIEDLKKFDKLHISSKSCDLELTPSSRPSNGSNHFLNECPEVDQNSFEEPVQTPESNTQ